MMKRTSQRSGHGRTRDNRRGAAVVEFAFCSSIIFMLFMGLIELSRFHVVRHSLDQAVYTGVRVGIVPGGTSAEVETAVRDRLALAGVVNASVTVEPQVIDENTSSVTARAVCNYADNAWSLPKYFSDLTISAEMTLDHEYVGYGD